MGFCAYIRKQIDRDDLHGDFARDFSDTKAKHVLRAHLETVETDTLYGIYMHVPSRERDEVISQIIADLWNEWIKSECIGLRFSPPEKGYVYIFQKPGENLFKIGKSKHDPVIRMHNLQIKHKLKLQIFNWMYLDNYSFVETDIKRAFKNYQVSGEWYSFKKYFIRKDKTDFCRELDNLLEAYPLVDSSCKMFKRVHEYDE